MSDPDALSMIVLAELHRVGLFDHVNLATIARRLELIGQDDTASRVLALPLSNALTDPEAMREGLYAIDGGGNDEGQ